jgi:C_GCAxxG_C_C family probable redox protein
MDEYKRRELLEEAYRLGFEYEKTYKGCAQCTIAALQDCLDAREDPVFRAASGLSGGCGLTIEGPCGGFTGGALVIGQLCGRERSDFLDRPGRRHRAYDAVEQLVRAFQQDFGSIVCREVQGGVFGRSYRLRDPEEFSAFEADGAHESKCPDVVGRAARLALSIILEAGLAPGRGPGGGG